MIPPYQDISTLCKNLCIGATTVDAWVKQGILPPPKLRGGKRLWKWTEVERALDGEPGDEMERIRNGAKEARAERDRGRNLCAGR
jgi:hypothetical protein